MGPRRWEITYGTGVILFGHGSEKCSARRSSWQTLTQPLVPGNLPQVSAARGCQLPQTRPHPAPPVVPPFPRQLCCGGHTSCVCRIESLLSPHLQWRVDGRGDHRGHWVEQVGTCAWGIRICLQRWGHSAQICAHLHTCVPCVAASAWWEVSMAILTTAAVVPFRRPGPEVMCVNRHITS